MLSRDFDFFRACDGVHPRMFALIRKNGYYINGPENVFLVRVFDTKSNTWHAMLISTENPEAGYGLVPGGRDMSCEDGGLLLFDIAASLGEKAEVRSFFYTVMNPLTGRSCDLPHIMNVRDVNMRHILVDREAHCCKVLIAVHRSDGGTTAPEHDIQVFDLETGEWSQPNEAADIIFGNQSAHDFVRGRSINQRGPIGKPLLYAKNVESYTYLKDHLFVLRKDTNGPASDVPTNQPSAMNYIREYAVEYRPHHPPRWLEVGIHRCNPFERVPSVSSHYKLRLLASNGFLLVFAAINERKTFESSRGWIYDLATRTWRDLPELPGPVVWMNSDDTCEIRWNAYP